MPYYVYILECKDKSLYTGFTNDLEKRIEKHNNSKSGAHYTKIRRPVKLKYYESFKTLSKALKREIAIKKLNRKGKIDLIIKKSRKYNLSSSSKIDKES